MWNTIDNIFEGRTNRRNRAGMGTFTAMMIGAGVGIAAWETMRRRGMGQTIQQVTGQMQGSDDDQQS